MLSLHQISSKVSQLTLRWSAFAAFFCCTLALRGDERDGIDFFEREVRPVLSKHCFSCHSTTAKQQKKLKGSLFLDSRDALLRGGDSGAAIVPGDPANSLILKALRYDGLEMPPSGALPKRAIAAIEEWIKIGAPWPESASDGSEKNGIEKHDLQDYNYWRKNHWAWRPVRSTPPAPIPHDNWSNGNIDRFVLRKLRATKLEPSDEAERAVLFRRMHVGLLGLPPSYEAVLAFTRDTRPDAYERAVDALLASPAFGEKWGRHWLDVARYADNGGFNSQTKELYTNYPYAFSYRDYVVTAFNEDLPYDRFILEQIAADHLDLGDDNRALAALGFLSLGDKSFGTSRNDWIDDCIDTVTRGVLGVTVSCARCHDHKYDPVPTADYYSLHTIFKNTTIDVVARLHTEEKSARLPVLFENQQSRDLYEHQVQRQSQLLDDARKRYAKKTRDHIRKRLADYWLSTAGSKKAAGLDRDILSRWRKLLTQDSEPKLAILDTWHRYRSAKNAKEIAQVTESLTAAGANPLLVDRLLKTKPNELSQVAQVYAAVIRQVESAKGEKDDGNDSIRQLINDKRSPLSLSSTELLTFQVHGGANELASLKKLLHAAKFTHPRAVAVKDRKPMTKGRVLIRGNPRKPGKEVPPQFLAILSPQREPYKSGSGRLDLAKALVDPSNPLTARVVVNRIWQHHFGQGLVKSASDFGTRSDTPSHPLLLDYLAARLIDDGWSLKRLHRRILLSKTYRQASRVRPEAQTVDPENRLLWRMNRKRLMFESIRDAMLVAGEALDRQLGGRPVDTWKSKRRTLYGYVNRYRIAPGYSTFDFPSTMRTSPGRQQTLVPQQSLFLMNSPFVEARALEVASTIGHDDPIAEVYQRILGRSPDQKERELARAFIDKRPRPGIANRWHRLAHALFLSNEFMYVD